MDRRQFIALSAASAAVGAAPLAAQTATKSRAAEVRSLRKFAEATHPRGLEAKADEQWRSRWSSLEADADRLSDGAYFLGLRRGLGWFGDGHTTPLPFDFTDGVPDALKRGPFGLTLPLRISLFHDGAWVTSAEGAAMPLLGRRLDRIGTREIADLIRSDAEHWPGNRAWAHRLIGFDLSSPAFLQGLGATSDAKSPVRFTAGNLSIDIRPTALPGGALTEVMRPTTDVERWTGDAGRGLFVRPLQDRRALYLSIDDMGDAKDYSFEKFTQDSFAALSLTWPERVIVDLRRNGGGNNFYGEALRKRLAASRFNRAGGLYVLTGPRTFSAAQNLVTRLERETFAFIVGEPTGGAPNHYGDAKLFKGESTGITSIVSALPWFDSYPQDRRPWIMPDILIPNVYADWEAGRDPALEVAMTQRAEPEDELNRSRIFFYNRPSQKAEWKPFWA